ncbi:putative WRKY transcription factor 4 [Acorus calamus]|uniref:WRKY transcription factor 4 n=1 Tax=Acorus calamus TaxID=4465 RepID=A0AAV9C3G2_ACOCL|nr:putative WRKY transcription factor 4 [Acorus calamus]KAK1283436.1 putative WRKY transcription factor 4 [Acorus calamus]KAK1284400.1 putative WRKY transcription factor 4 [Acorus calamus]
MVTRSSTYHDRKGSIEGEINRGRDSAMELQNLLLSPNGDRREAEAVMLIEDVLRSFAKTLSVLKSNGASDVSNLSSSSTVNIGRKRKRGENSSITWSVNSVLPLDDRQSWNKYGQKKINGSQFPRSYYKCSNKKTCPATKQVQQLEHGDHTMYHVVYRNEHTCVHNSMTSDRHPESGTPQRDEIPPNSESNDHQSSSEENPSFHATFTTINDQSPSTETWPELSSEFWSFDNMISNYELKPDSSLPIEDDLNYTISDGSYVNLWDFKEEFDIFSSLLG